MGLLLFLAISMLYLLLLYSLFIFTVSNCFPTGKPVLCHEDESFALLQFKQSFVITEAASKSSVSYPKTTSWIRSTDCCSWDGVECDEETGHVIGLDLGSSQLYGSIGSNSTLFHLLQLQSLNLSHNHFNYSQIPSRLAHLSRLKHLDLSWSKFSGEIPDEISQLSKLLTLDLCFNYVDSYPQINLLQLKQQNFRSIIQNLTNLEVLSLKFVNISSPIPNTLTNLSSLQHLALVNSKVYGEFPSGIFHLPNLLYLNLGANQDLTGYLPEFHSGGPLQALGLQGTSFQGNLPVSIGNLNALKILAIGGCKFSGSIPSSLGNLTQLMSLDLSGNKFHGEIPHSIFSLKNLRDIFFCKNLLIGQIELDMFFLNFKNLTHLCLSKSNLSLLTKSSSFNASLPKNIKSLQLASCNINEFPKLLEDQDQLEMLDLKHNEIHDTLPSWIWRNKKLWLLALSENVLEGEIPPLICNLKSLELLDLSFNNLSGQMPPCLGNFSKHLDTLKLGNNMLSGLIPQTYMKRNALNMIDISQNNLQGQLPKALVNCRKLEYLDVSNNLINDSFPFWLGTLPELKVLALRSNKFYGAISSPRTSMFTKLHVIDLSQNDFSGNLSSELFQNWESMRASNMNQLKYGLYYHYKRTGDIDWLFNSSYSFTIFNKGNLMVYKKLQEFYFFIAIDLSSNNLGGSIPNAIGDLKGLVLLNMSNNLFTGGIPSSLGKLSQLEALDLSHNKLSGKIPQQLTELTFLEFFNVSKNYLSGPIPQSTQFDTFERNSFEENQGLCGTALLKKCEDLGKSSLAPPSATNEDEDSGSLFEFDWRIVVIGFGGGLVFGLAMGSTLILEKHALLLLKMAHIRVQRRY